MSEMPMRRLVLVAAVVTMGGCQLACYLMTGCSGNYQSNSVSEAGAESDAEAGGIAALGNCTESTSCMNGLVCSYGVCDPPCGTCPANYFCLPQRPLADGATNVCEPHCNPVDPQLNDSTHVACGAGQRCEPPVLLVPTAALPQRLELLLQPRDGTLVPLVGSEAGVADAGLGFGSGLGLCLGELAGELLLECLTLSDLGLRLLLVRERGLARGSRIGAEALDLALGDPHLFPLGAFDRGTTALDARPLLDDGLALTGDRCTLGGELLLTRLGDAQDAVVLFPSDLRAASRAPCSPRGGGTVHGFVLAAMRRSVGDFVRAHTCNVYALGKPCQGTLRVNPDPAYASFMAQRKVTVTEYTCERCGHVWVPRKAERPRICPHCKSAWWDEKRPGKKKVAESKG